MFKRVKWFFILALFLLTSLFVWQFQFSSIQLGKEELFTKNHSDFLSMKSLHERKGVEKVLLQKDKDHRIIYHIHYPSSHFNFKPSPKGVLILEDMASFQIWYEDPPQRRLFEGTEAVYDFKHQTFQANDFQLSIYDREALLFQGLGQNLSFYFHELKPCFSSKNFTAHLNLEGS